MCDKLCLVHWLILILAVGGVIAAYLLRRTGRAQLASLGEEGRFWPEAQKNNHFFFGWWLYFLAIPYLLLSILGLLGMPGVVVGYGVFSGLHIWALAFMVLVPLFAKKLLVSKVSNEPAGSLKYLMETRHFYGLPIFTAIENGRAKAVVNQGEKAVRYIINKSGDGFRCEIVDANPDTYWEVTDDPKYTNARNVWEAYVERSGLVFVGIYPFKRVYHYKIKPAKILTNTTTQSRDLVIRPEEYSDHVRVREFNWGSEVKVPLRGYFTLRVTNSFRLQCTNPHQLLFGVDAWDESFADAVSNRTIWFMQDKTPEKVVNATAKDRGKLADGITEMSKTVNPKMEHMWGLQIIETQVSAFTWVEDTERDALVAVEIAKRKKKATVLEYEAEGDGQYYVLDKRAQAIHQHGAAGRQASRDEMLETGAEKGNKTIFTGTGEGDSSESEQTKLLKAILTQLQGGNNS